MEKKLKSLFEYQKFAQNDRLRKMIEETESRVARELSDDDLFLVNAAGSAQMPVPETDNMLKRHKKEL